MAEFGPVEEFIPHSGAMVLLSRILEHSETTTRCLVEISEQTLFKNADGTIDGLIGIEFMAQCVALHAGIAARGRGGRPTAGYLLGTRRLSLDVERYWPDQRIVVEAQQIWGKATGMFSFDCWLRDHDSGVSLAEARLNCYLPPDGTLGIEG